MFTNLLTNGIKRLVLENNIYDVFVGQINLHGYNT